MKTIELKNIIAPAYYQLHRQIQQNKHRHYWIYGGRACGKSTFVGIELVLGLLSDPNSNAIVIRRVAKTLKDSVYNQIYWCIEQLSLQSHFKFLNSPLQINYIPTGQVIYFRGADNPDKIKSIKPKKGFIRFAWYEELDEFEGMAAIRKINQSIIRGGTNFRIFYTFNPPRSVYSWVNKEVKTLDKNHFGQLFTYKDLPEEWLGTDFMAEAASLEANDLATYEHELLGIPVGTGGTVFENVEALRMTEEEVQKFDNIYRGLDWGYAASPFVLIQAHFDPTRKKLYIFDELVLKGHTNSDLAFKMEKKVTKYDLITADSAEPKSIAEFRRMGWHMRPAEKGKDSIRFGIKWLQGLSKIYIDPYRCPVAYKQFLEYELARNRDGSWKDEYVDENNDCIDAIRYALESVMEGRSNRWKALK